MRQTNEIMTRPLNESKFPEVGLEQINSAAPQSITSIK